MCGTAVQVTPVLVLRLPCPSAFQVSLLKSRLAPEVSEHSNREHFRESDYAVYGSLVPLTPNIIKNERFRDSHVANSIVRFRSGLALFV